MKGHECHYCRNADIQPEYRYCARCGYLDARLITEQIQSQVSVAKQGVSRVTLDLLKVGFSDLRGKLTLDNPEGVEWIAIENGHATGQDVEFSLGANNNPQQITLVFDADQLPDRAREAGETQFSLIFDLETGPDGGPEFRDVEVEQHSQVTGDPVKVLLRDSGRLSVLPELLLFSETERQRDFTLRNSGGSRVRVSDVELPSGFLLVSGEDRDRGQALTGTHLMPDEEVEVAIQLADEVLPPAGLVRACFHYDDDGSVELALAKDLRPPVLRGTTERYHVCVDFGTSKTAAAYADMLAKNEVAQLIQLDESHDALPSAVFIEEKSGQLIVSAGRGAEESFESNTHARIQAIKTKLRREEIAFRFPEEGVDTREESLPVGEVLGPLLRTVHNGITNHFREIDDYSQYEDSSRHLFSLPILDAETLISATEDSAEEGETAAESIRASAPASDAYRIQKQVTLESARASGFHGENPLEAVPEPHCVAAYAIFEKGCVFEPGDTVCIYDFGAGTLDVAVMEVCGEDELEELLTIGQFIADEDRGQAQDDFELSGDFLDRYILAALVRKMAADAERDGKMPYLARPDYYDPEEHLEFFEQDSSGHLVPKPGYVVGGTILLRETMLGHVRVAKERLYADGKEAENFVLDLTEGEASRTKAGVIAGMLRPWIQRSAEVIRERCKAVDVKIPFDHIVLSGGSSLIPLVKRILGPMARNIVESDSQDDAVYAVARGGPHLSRISFTRPSPYEIKAVDTARRFEPIVVCDAKTSWPSSESSDVLRNAQGEWELQVSYDGHNYVVATFRVDSDDVQLVFGVTEDGSVGLRRRLPGASDLSDREALVRL